VQAHVRAVVLAAGKGTRMKSALPKVMHELAGRPMLWYVLRALRDAGVIEIVVVVSDELEPHVADVATDAGHASVITVVQSPQLGTGHAVQIALARIEPRDGTLLVLTGDLPLIEATLISRAIASRTTALSLVTAVVPDPTAFGRIVRDGDGVSRIVEERDATDAEREIDEVNAGLYAYDERKLRAAIAGLRADNAQNEYYLTDTIAALVGAGERVLPVVSGDHRVALGVNDRAELARAASFVRLGLCEKYMRAGVTIVDPATTYLEPDLEFATDVTILPNTTIGRGTSVAEGGQIGPNARVVGSRIGRFAVVTESVVVDSTIGEFALVGPFAHVRGGSKVGTATRIGNFVELKNARLAAGVKAGHLSYLGDVTIGDRTNVGAGTITCNYDGKQKNETHVGKDAFIGSNSSLVAPLTIGDDALTGAGAVVLSDVGPGERVVGNPARVLPAK
jgi:bifunctional UDP-N-acetylglucosamine pyrophosphorylase/glucosamine-1-phosphate N-acetyltransferase